MTTELRAETLSLSVQGRVLRAADAEFDSARHIWNGMIDRRPALDRASRGRGRRRRGRQFRARRRTCRSPSAAVATAPPGSSVCDGGLMLDLSLMKELRVDPARRTARAQAGLTLGRVRC